jgi:hypothetical protein
VDVVPVPDDPPDFFLVSLASRIAVEVTRIYRHENRKGSAAAADEYQFQRFVSELEVRYLTVTEAQPIQVSVALPPIIRSRAVRRFSRKEYQADLANVAEQALAVLRRMPALEAWAKHEFYVQQRDGRHVSFHVLRLPAGKSAPWDVMNNTVGWIGSVPLQVLQERIREKAGDLPRYRSEVASTYLLVVADGSVASGFLELPPGAVLDAAGFDAVYFQRYPFDDTRLVAEAGQTT